MKHDKIKLTYANKAKVKWAVEVARECGLDVKAIEFSPDGTIRVAEVPTPDPAELTDFDRFKDQL